MTGKVMELLDVISPDRQATRLTEKYLEWDSMRQPWKDSREEVRRYVYATDTRQTSNSSLPWKNSTTIPKLCQIADNLIANYMASLFPQRKWVLWEANEMDANSRNKRDAIVNYMMWAIEQPGFKHEMEKVVYDYVHNGNCIVTVDWIDQRVQQEGRTQSGYIGPTVRRINPMDIVFNPTAENFIQTPKLIRTITSLGELKMMLENMSTPENKEEYQKLFEYLRGIRLRARTFDGDISQRDRLYQMDGFGSFREYLHSDYVEVLTFYGDWYDPDNDVFEKNRVITVVDRHKLINNKANPSFFGYPPIFHAAWRKKQDNLWGMGPLDNLVGMQYRMDHMENMKADIVDLVTYPVQKIKGFVEDYVWQPGEKIFVSEEGDVDLVSPDVQPLMMNSEIQNLERLMEEMAGAPREAMGFRTPGEKTKYEVQALENAASRIFQNKIKQFEEQIVEPVLNAMLELAQRNLSGATVIKIFDDEFKAESFQTLSPDDITGAGRIRPVAARHFSEQANLIQNLTNLTSSGLWPAVQPHFSTKTLAKIVEVAFDLQQTGAMIPWSGLADQAEAQQIMNTLQQNVMRTAGTATGQGEDFDLPPEAQMQSDQQAMMMAQGMQ